jgi:hypothetical protein
MGIIEDGKEVCSPHMHMSHINTLTSCVVTIDVFWIGDQIYWTL